MAQAELPSTWSKVAQDLHANSLWILPLIAFERAFEGFPYQAAFAGALWVVSAIVAVKLHVFQELITKPERRQQVLTWALILGGTALLAFGIAKLASRNAARTNPSGFTQQDVDKQVAAATAALKQQLEQLQTALQETQQQRDQALSRHSAAVTTQPPLSSLSAQDIATQIGVWTLIDDRMNDLAALLNRGYEQLDKWKASTRSDRNKEIKDFSELGAGFEAFRRQLDDFRGLYLHDPQIASTLAPVVIPGGRTFPSATIFLALRASIEQFIEQVQNLNDGLTDLELEKQMIPYVGALKRDLNAMRSWQGQVQRTSGDQQKHLSKLEAK